MSTAHTKPRLLIVDDNKAVRTVFASEAEKYGEFSEIRAASDGVDALRCMQARAGAAHWVPDIILTDLYMPNLNGAELLGELRRLGITPATSVLMSSSSDCVYERAVAKTAGCQSFCGKPNSSQGIRELLSSIAAAHRTKGAATLTPTAESSHPFVAAAHGGDQFLRC